MPLFRSTLTTKQDGAQYNYGFLAMIIGVARKSIAAAIERRKIRRALHALDDYLLKDMGISRADIERISNRTYSPR